MAMTTSKNKERKKTNLEKNNYKALLCPVCQDFYFSEWQDGDENSEFYCSRCGWKYDLAQAENADLKHQTNEMSVNEYRKWWQDKIEQNPSYDFSEEQQHPKTPHTCPVCQKYEFEDMGSFDICPFCGWEDDELQLKDPNYEGGANELSLNLYRQKYNQCILTDPMYKW